MQTDQGIEPSDGGFQSKEYESGLQALKDNRLEEAVQLIGQGLQALVDKFGAASLDCAAAYYKYGLALFHRAQEESDVFGDTLQSAVTKHEDGPSADVHKEAADAGASSSLAEEQVDQDEDAEGDAGGEEDDEAVEDDMQLAWENLEVARQIYQSHESTHASELANVHILLADLASEQESFEEALTDLKKSQDLLTQLLQADDRRLAEIHFKTALNLQFLNQPEDALLAIRRAIATCELAVQKQNLDEAKESEAAADDLDSVLSDLRAKEEELQDSIKELETTKNTIRSAFQSVISAPAAQPSSGGSKVMDLGVVGQGKKRIQLVPMAPTSKTDASNGQQSKNIVDSRPKRSLEDLMDGAKSLVGSSTEMLGPGATSKRPAIAKPAALPAADASAAVSTKPAAKSLNLPEFPNPKPKEVQETYGSKPETKE